MGSKFFRSAFGLTVFVVLALSISTIPHAHADPGEPDPELPVLTW